MCSDRRKNHGFGQKKTGGTSSARIGLRTGAKCGELKRCAHWVPSRADNLRWSPRRQIRNLNFSPSTKKTSEYSFELFILLIKLFWLLWSLLKRRSPHDFGPKARNTEQGYLKSLPPHIGDPVVWTDGRSRDYYVTIKIYSPDKLRNLLSNGAPLLSVALQL